MSMEMKTFKGRGRVGCCAASDAPKSSAQAIHRGEVVIPGNYAPRLRPVRAEHEPVLLEAVVAGEALLRSGTRGELRLAVAGVTLESPAAARGETHGILHHHVHLT